jgi:putative proteasome-type protease
MTYCVGILVREGLVMIADTRTNAGVDNIATFRKLSVINVPNDRAIGIATAGNLATSQAVVTLATTGMKNPETGALETIYTVPTMFQAAYLIGRAVREAHRMEGRSDQEAAAQGFDVTILLGGQIKTGQLRLFLCYSAGNFIQATADTPYLQIGEHKYGKPILDRAVTVDTTLSDALKLGLLSMDSTMRSNLSVGMPLDIMMIRRDTIAVDVSHRIEQSDPYFQSLRQSWSEALRAAHRAIPPPPYKSDGN